MLRMAPLTLCGGEKNKHRSPGYLLIKRAVVGTFHKVSRKYMPLYVREFEFRYNNRHNPDIFGTAIKGC
jgi:hypothetical protein